MNSVDSAVHRVRLRGGKITPQRLVIFQLLEGNRNHPTADAIYAQARRLMPTISLTTVYKTLNELVEMGELKRFDLAGIAHFDPDTKPHAEAVCLTCGHISDVEHHIWPGADDIGGFIPISSALTIYGYCPQCGRPSARGNSHG